MAVMALSLIGRDAQSRSPYPAVMVDDMDKRERFAYALREVLRVRKMSQAELATQLGRSEQTIQRWASAATVPSVLEIGPLADALGIDPIYFIRPPEPQPYPVRDFLREVTGAAEAEGRDRASRQDQGQQPEAHAEAQRKRTRRTRSSEK